MSFSGEEPSCKGVSRREHINTDKHIKENLGLYFCVGDQTAQVTQSVLFKWASHVAK